MIWAGKNEFSSRKCSFEFNCELAFRTSCAPNSLAINKHVYPSQQSEYPSQGIPSARQDTPTARQTPREKAVVVITRSRRHRRQHHTQVFRQNSITTEYRLLLHLKKSTSPSKGRRQHPPQPETAVQVTSVWGGQWLSQFNSES